MRQPPNVCAGRAHDRARERAATVAHVNMQFSPDERSGWTRLDNLGDDSCYLHRPLGFTFTGFGANTDTISVSSNGLLFFGPECFTHFVNGRLPTGITNVPLLAYFWDDLQDFGAGEYIEYATSRCRSSHRRSDRRRRCAPAADRADGRIARARGHARLLHAPRRRRGACAMPTNKPRPPSKSGKPASQGRGANASQDAATVALQQAIELVVWGTPIVGFDAMRQAFVRDAGATYGDIVYWSRPADWRLQIATPNASTYYVYLNFNTSQGPVVLDIPAALGGGLFGSILDAWQVPAADIGPEGEDRGQGGSYLLLPPGAHDEEVPGTIPVRLPTYNGYALLRAIPDGSSPAAVQRALALVQQLRTYPATRMDDPPPPRFVDMTGALFDGITRFDDTFFDSLAHILDEEPLPPRDAAMVERLAALGIVKGRPFRPDPTMRDLMTSAARAAHALFESEVPDDGRPAWPGRRWRWPPAVGAETGWTFVTDQGLDTPARARVYFLACAPPRRLGKASAYLMSFVDRDGDPLTGYKSYHLHVPANVPARQFWAVTVYDLTTASFIRDSPRVEINSYDPAIARNPDGSVDLYFGPEPPAGLPANWAYTAPGKPWFTLFRCYGPEPALFDQRWQLPDFAVVEEGG